MTWTRAEAVSKAKRELLATGTTQVIVRRGYEYKVYPITESVPRGYKVAEMISTGNVQNY